MTLQSKFLFVVAAFCIATLLGACVTSGPPPTPFRLPEIQYGETSESTYFWTMGSSSHKHPFDQTDYATITRINGTVIPSNIVSVPYTGPRSKLVEFPAGELVVEILYSEQNNFLCSFGSCVPSNRSRRVMAFTGWPNRIYVPFANDWCSQDSFWIEDWGTYESDSKVEKSPLLQLASNSIHPVVAGERPRTGACEVRMAPTKTPNIVSEPISGEGVSVFDYYGEAEDEVNTKSYDKNLWAKAFVEAEGDEQKRKVRYIELRGNQLYSENVSSISKSNLNEQPYLDSAVSGAVLSGIYVSDIQRGPPWMFSDRKPWFTFEQNGNDIIGTDVSKNGSKIYGIRNGDTIKFKYWGSFRLIVGRWKINPDGTSLEGTWEAEGERGSWNLTRIE